MKGPRESAFSGSLAEAVSGPEVDVLQAQQMPGEPLEARGEDLRMALESLLCGLRVRGGQDRLGPFRWNLSPA